MKSAKPKNEKYIALILIIGAGIALSYFAWFDQMWEGGGDNYWHYYFSKYAYKYPKFFLHHWGKPIFIFLSAPFSQFGFYGINIFNILCGLGSAWVVYLFSRALGFRASWAAPVITLFAVNYFLVLQSAMTEPLFSLLLILSSYLLFKQKYLSATILASFLIYSRTEGVLILAIYSVYLVLIRQWKYIPLFGSAFLLYSLVGFFSGHDFLWFFTENPYSEGTPYGHGTWNHFLKLYHVIFGLPHLLLLLPGLCLLFYFIIKNKEFPFKKPLGDHAKVFILVFVPAILFFIFHSYAWAKGKYASAGLERVMSCILPYSSLLCMYTVHLFNHQKINKYIGTLISLCICVFIVRAPFRQQKYPILALDGAEKIEREAAAWFVKAREGKKVIYYAHPAIVFFGNYDPFAPENRECLGFPNDCNFKDMPPFYYIWDSQFSAQTFGCNNQLETLMHCAELKLRKEFSDQYFKVCIFEYSP